LHLGKRRVPSSNCRYPKRRVGRLQRLDDFVQSPFRGGALAGRMHYDFLSAVAGASPGRCVGTVLIQSPSEKFTMKTESNDVENPVAGTEAQPQPQPAESVDIKSLSVELFQFVGGGSGITNWF
jgi:hypothetical protein